jgi:hypothetical protein
VPAVVGRRQMIRSCRGGRLVAGVADGGRRGKDAACGDGGALACGWKRMLQQKQMRISGGDAIWRRLVRNCWQLGKHKRTRVAARTYLIVFHLDISAPCEELVDKVDLGSTRRPVQDCLSILRWGSGEVWARRI